MGLLEKMICFGNALGEIVGLEYPNQVFTEEFRCRDCGLTWYYPKPIKSNTKTKSFGSEADSRYLCIGNGRTHHLVRVNRR